MTTRFFKRTMDLLGIQKPQKRNRRKQEFVSAPRELDFDMEALENRQMLAGNVTAILAGTNLTLIGDSADNQIEISQSGSQITVQGLDDTNIIFQGESASSHVLDLSSPGLRNLNVRVNGGNDDVSVQDVELSGSLLMVGGGGNDSFYGQNLAVGRNMTANMGSGADRFTVRDSGVGGNVSANLGSAPSAGSETLFAPLGDSLDLNNTRVSGNVTVRQQANSGYVYLGNVDIERNLTIDTGTGSDSVFLYKSTVAGNAQVNLGSADANNNDQIGEGYEGGDRAGFADTTVSGNLTVQQTANRGQVGFYGTDVEGNLAVSTGAGSDIIGSNRGSASARGGSAELNVGGQATFNLGSSSDGQDELLLRASNFEGDLSVSQTSGDSFIRLNGNNYYGFYYGSQSVNVDGNLNVSTGSGDDFVTAYTYGWYGGSGSLWVGGDATINLGSADAEEEYGDRGGRRDSFVLSSTHISGNLSVMQTGNAGSVFMGASYYSNGVVVDGDLAINLGSGSDSVRAYAYDYGFFSSGTALTVGGNAEINMGAAARDSRDQVDLSATQISGDLTIRQTANTADINLGSYNNYYYYYGESGGDTRGVVVGNDLNISTGTGSDRVDTFYNTYYYDRADSGTAVVVGGNATIDLGSSSIDAEFRGGFGGDRADLELLNVDGNLTIRQTANSGEINASSVVVGGSADIRTGSGNDFVQIDDDAAPNNNRAGGTQQTLFVDTGSGDDGVSIQDVALGNIDIRLGSGNDTADIEYVNVNGDFSIDMGADRDMVNILESQFFASMEFIGGRGFDSVAFDGVSMFGDDPVFEATEEITGLDEQTV